MVKLTEEQRCLLILLKENRLDCVDSVSWESIRDLILRHRLLPLLANSSSDFSEPTKGEIDDLKREQVMKSMAITGELLSLYKLPGINSKNIIVTKGPAIAKLLYSEVGQRQFNDLDLHVHPDYLNDTLEALLQSGYRVLYPSINNFKTYKYYFQYKRDIGLINPRSKVYIELHKGINIMKWIPVECESDFYANLFAVEILGREIQTLKNEFHFIYLCIHGAKHLYNRLIWLKDIVDFMKFVDLDHLYISGLIQKYGLQHIFGLTMLLAEEIFDVNTPDVYQEIIGFRKTRMLKTICSRRIFGAEKEGLKMKIVKYFYFMQLKSGLSYKLHLLKGIFHRWYIRKYLGGQ